MGNKQLCKTINIFNHSISLDIAEDWNFELELEWSIQSVNPNLFETGSKILIDQISS